MADEIHGRLNQRYELLIGSDAVGASTGELVLNDPELVEMVLRRFARDEMNLDALRRLLRDDPRAAETLLADPRVVTEVARRLAMGGIVARHSILTRHFPSDLASGQMSDMDTEPPPEVQEIVRDWFVECQHHASPDSAGRGQEGRELFHHKSNVDVVPSVGTTVDTVKLQWRDDELGSPPRAEVVVSCPGHADVNVAASGSAGAYSTYPIQAHYYGDIDIFAFILPSFWDAFRETTSHTVYRGPAPVVVRVFNPRKFKFEFAMPPLRSYKRGFKLGADSADVRQLAKPKNLEKKLEEERDGWGPATVKLPKFAQTMANTTSPQEREDGGAWTDKNPAAEYGATGARIKNAAGDVKIDSLKLSRDDLTIDPPNALMTISEILRLYRRIAGIIKTIKDYAPQTGFYVDFDVQLLQGGMAVEWMYKEFEDQRAFLAWDVNLKLTVIAVKLEIGVGVAAAGFKLQVFGQLLGELGVEAGYKRETPDGPGGFQLPTVKGKISGALGARAEAGNFVKLEGKGETAFELEVGVGINLRNSPVTVDAKVRWSGMWFIGTFSAGAFGVSYTKTARCELCGPSSWWGMDWPKSTPYRPPVMSRDAVSTVFSTVMTKGWNVRVFDDDEDRVSMRDVADMLADRVIADKQFDLTPDDVEALANSVRQDLDAMGERWGRDWVALADLRRYMAGTPVRGRSLSAHLERGHVDPLLARQ